MDMPNIKELSEEEFAQLCKQLDDEIFKAVDGFVKKRQLKISMQEIMFIVNSVLSRRFYNFSDTMFDILQKDKSSLRQYLHLLLDAAEMQEKKR